MPVGHERFGLRELVLGPEAPENIPSNIAATISVGGIKKPTIPPNACPSWSSGILSISVRKKLCARPIVAGLVELTTCTLIDIVCWMIGSTPKARTVATAPMLATYLGKN